MLESQKEPFQKFVHHLQDRICSALEESEETASFREDLWERDGGGGGRTRVLENGKVIEKGGVNVSVVHGEITDALRSQLNVEGSHFYATGLSLVIHPRNPMAPTAHANIRYFEVSENGTPNDAWFGGGMDLTPYYLFEEDARHFHEVNKRVCADYYDGAYMEFKQECDNYFRNHHRDEGRGIGGIFFDHQRAAKNRSLADILKFVEKVGEGFVDAYKPILDRRKTMSYTDEQRHWQELRRGRYVEFNLIHDRGTIFGLKSNGRIESILMSLPPRVRWDYNVEPKPDTPEARLLDVLKDPIDWVEL